MKKNLLLNIALLFSTIGSSQQTSCADSSYRIKYTFSTQGASFYNNPDTSGTNMFTGGFAEGLNHGLALLRTNWGDSMIWAKRIYINSDNMLSVKEPSGTIICTGSWGGPVSNNPEMLLSRIDTNGIVLWIKRYKLSQNHFYFVGGNGNSVKNILVANNAIYATATMYYANQTGAYLSIVTKLDLDGNIIWSKGFGMNNLWLFPSIGGIPVLYNNSVLVLGYSKDQVTPGPGSERYSVLTRLNDLDGSLIESNTYKAVTDILIKGTTPSLIKSNPDNSLSLTGFIDIEVIPGSGLYYTSNNVFNSRLDANLNPVYNFYYKNYIPLLAQNTFFDFNNLNRHSFLSESSGYNKDKYFVTFGPNYEVQRSRKFTISSSLSSINTNSINFDDKQNLHFLYHYPQSGKQVTEYARISNFAPDGTLSCFGKDTGILTQYPFTITKQPFTWDIVQSDVIVSNDVLYTEDTAIVTKELVCKIVSYCDSININGPASACVGQPVRYTINKNNGCFKNMDWLIDTTLANIISTEGDSAITISFKKAFAGYIHAAITGCVVKDSFFVTVVPSPIVYITNRDSLLCPGKTIVLTATPGFTNYLWQDGSTADSFLVTTPGFYKVTGTSYCSIQSSDSIVINNSDTSLIIPATQTICRYDTAFIILPGDVNNITWQPATSSLLNNKTLLLFPKQNSIYNITAERLANCPITKTTQVNIKICPELIFIPNAFTPNNDGVNDSFKASTYRLLQFYQLVIYNRYGQKLFETNELSAGWDGTFKGKPQATGGYTYSCSYYFTGGVQRSESGYFILIR
jgi:gliding motility-associated-like protein